MSNRAKAKTVDPNSILTTEPLPGSRKVYLEGSRPEVRVPMREVSLSNGEHFLLYDTSGPYTDPQASIDLTRGIRPLRLGWVEARQDTDELANFSSEFSRKRNSDGSLAGIRFPHLLDAHDRNRRHTALRPKPAFPRLRHRTIRRR